MGGNYDYNLKGDFGVKVRLHGWSHTRTYAQGFLRNQPGNPTATVSGLKPNQGYTYRIYQTDTGGYSGMNGFQVNGVTKPDTFQGGGDNAAPSATGVTTAKSDGTILFTFVRKIWHVHLSSMSITPLAAPTAVPGCDASTQASGAHDYCYDPNWSV